MIRFFILIILSTTLQATTFKPQPIEQQIKESDGLFVGNFLKRKTIELEDGKLATQMFFKMDKEAGLESEFYGMDEIIVHYPGGELNGKHVQVEGIPEFVSGEKVVLFIRSLENRYWGMNLGFGTYKVINYGKETMMVNYIFPDLAGVGQVNFQHFEKLVKDIKGSELKIVQIQYPTTPDSTTVQRLPASVPEGQNRTVASEAEGSDNDNDRPSLNIYWLLLVLAVTGGLFRLGNRKV